MMDRLAGWHDTLQLTISVALFYMMLWGLFLFVLRREINQKFFSGLWITFLLIASQALIGFALWFGGRDPLSLVLHLAYGILAVAALPAAHLYLRDRKDVWQPLFYAGFFGLVLGMIIRSFETGA